jgi:hypothetical protein
VLIYSERKVLLATASGWFVLREKYGWLVADKTSYLIYHTSEHQRK